MFLPTISFFRTLSLIKLLLVQVTNTLVVILLSLRVGKTCRRANLTNSSSSTAEGNNACQTGNRCAKERGRRRGNEEGVEAAEMTHTGATRYEFAMILLGLLALGPGSQG